MKVREPSVYIQFNVQLEHREFYGNYQKGFFLHNGRPNETGQMESMSEQVVESKHFITAACMG